MPFSPVYVVSFSKAKSEMWPPVGANEQVKVLVAEWWSGSGGGGEGVCGLHLAVFVYMLFLINSLCPPGRHSGVEQVTWDQAKAQELVLAFGMKTMW